MQMLDFYVFVTIHDINGDIDLLSFLKCFICLEVRFDEVSVALLFYLNYYFFLFFLTVKFYMIYFILEYLEYIALCIKIRCY